MSNKRCSKCSIEKPVEQFSRRSSSRDGLDSWCKACTAEKRSVWYVANRERVMEQSRAYYAANAERYAERNRAWRKSNPEMVAKKLTRHRARHPARAAARYAVSYAVRRGKMPSPRDLPCSTCGAPAEHYHHHKGYAPENALDVVPVCVTCHVELDKEVN